MIIDRRCALRLAASASAVASVSPYCFAQTYPTRPVRVIVSFAAGGPTDILARILGEKLSERLGQSFVIENKPGAGGNIGAETVVRADPDGHTLMMVDASPTISATLYKDLTFNFVRDIVPIAGVARQPQVLLVHPTIPARTIAEFIAYAKANPGKINMASAGIGTPPHMAGELFNIAAGVKLVHVPYRGSGAAVADLIGGHVQMSFFGPVASLDYIKSGKLFALAVTGQTRSELLPDVPSVAESLPGFEFYSWFGVGAPKGTPLAVVGSLSKTITSVVGDPMVQARFAQLGAAPFPLTSEQFGKHISSETDKWTGVIRTANIKHE